MPGEEKEKLVEDIGGGLAYVEAIAEVNAAVQKLARKGLGWEGIVVLVADQVRLPHLKSWTSRKAVVKQVLDSFKELGRAH